MAYNRLMIYLAEALGTLGLTLGVALGFSYLSPLPPPFAAALTLGLFVYTIGPLSGAHLNPAVTIGLWSMQKIKTSDAIAYVIAQLVGAEAALLLVRLFVYPAVLPAVNTLPVFFAEIIGAFFFTFGVAAAVSGKVPDDIKGVVVGGSLLSGIALASSRSNGILNPAVALGVGSLAPAYVLGPIIGAILGLRTYRLLRPESV